MATTLLANIPSLKDDTISIKLDATLPNETSKTAVVSGDIKELLPWANLASEEARDFFFLSTIIYGVDRFIPRRPYSVDGWSREIKLTVPVYKVAKWKECKESLEKLLSFLTGDYWSLSFYKNTFLLPNKNLSTELQVEFQQVNLFSGGLDSLIGAIDTLEKSNKKSLFISHYDPLMKGPKKDQEDLGQQLTTEYGNRFNHLSSTKVYLAHSDFSGRETSSRSRSLLFIGLALLLADAKKINIVVPENGTVSLNYPLSPSRRSACSTRTTHPTFLSLLAIIFGKLNIKSKIENAYRFKTKGEMVVSCSNKPLLEKILHLSNSCGKRGHRTHWERNGSHCGICMPCIYRHASLINMGDSTPYGNKITDLDFSTKKGQDVGALLDFLHRKITKTDVKFELIANGLKDQENLYKYIDLIVRTRKELSAWIKKNGNKFVRTKAGL